MPEREHHELAFFDAVIEKVANATKVQAPDPQNLGIDKLRSNARLPKQNTKCRLDVFAKRFGRRKAIL